MWKKKLGIVFTTAWAAGSGQTNHYSAMVWIWKRETDVSDDALSSIISYRNHETRDHKQGDYNNSDILFENTRCSLSNTSNNKNTANTNANDPRVSKASRVEVSDTMSIKRPNNYGHEAIVEK